MGYFTLYRYCKFYFVIFTIITFVLIIQGFYPFLIAHKFLIMIGTRYQYIHSKKITLHLFAHTAFLLFLIYYIIAILRLFCELTYPPENIDSVMTSLSLFIIFIITSRIAYIIIENSISFILAVIFSRKLKTYSSARKTNELMEKYNPTFLFLNGDKFK